MRCYCIPVVGCQEVFNCGWEAPDSHCGWHCCLQCSCTFFLARRKSPAPPREARNASARARDYGPAWPLWSEKSLLEASREELLPYYKTNLRSNQNAKGAQIKMWYIHTMVYYLALKKKEILSPTKIWTNLKDVMLSEISQSQKEKYCGISLIFISLSNRRTLRNRK